MIFCHFVGVDIKEKSDTRRVLLRTLFTFAKFKFATGTANKTCLKLFLTIICAKLLDCFPFWTRGKTKTVLHVQQMRKLVGDPVGKTEILTIHNKSPEILKYFQ